MTKKIAINFVGQFKSSLKCAWLETKNNVWAIKKSAEMCLIGDKKRLENVLVNEIWHGGLTQLANFIVRKLIWKCEQVYQQLQNHVLHKNLSLLKEQSNFGNSDIAFGTFGRAMKIWLFRALSLKSVNSWLIEHLVLKNSFNRKFGFSFRFSRTATELCER